MGAVYSFPLFANTTDQTGGQNNDNTRDRTSFLDGSATYFGPNFIFNSVGTTISNNAATRTYFDDVLNILSGNGQMALDLHPQVGIVLNLVTCSRA